MNIESLNADDWSVECAPSLGGTILSASHAGREVLRRTTADSLAKADPRFTACFPLVPFANRIRDGYLRFRGRDIFLPPNIDGEALPLHGYGWLMPWQVTQRSASSLQMEVIAVRGLWPWRWKATQCIDISAQGLKLEIAVTNDDDTDMPAGIGLHPYFPAGQGAMLTADVTQVWLADEARVSRKKVVPPPAWDLRQGVKVGQLVIDNTFAGWSGDARLLLHDGTLQLALHSSESLRHLAFYHPAQGDFFCLEPVSHRVDALNALEEVNDGGVVLRPGETLCGTLLIAVK
jgi:aldose 1-epimerase